MRGSGRVLRPPRLLLVLLSALPQVLLLLQSGSGGMLQGRRLLPGEPSPSPDGHA